MTHDGENKNTNLTRSEEKGGESKSRRSRADGGNATSTNSRKIAKDASILNGIPQVSDTTININTVTDSHGNNSDVRGGGESAATTRRQSKNDATRPRSNVVSTDDSLGPESLGPPTEATTDGVDAEIYNDVDVLGPPPDTENARTINSKSLPLVDSTGIGGGNQTQSRPQLAPADVAEALVEVPGEVNSSGRNKDRRRRSKRLASATSLSSAEISPSKKDRQSRSQPHSRRTPSSSSSSSSNPAKPQNEARDAATSSPSSAAATAATAKELKSVPSDSKRRKRSRAVRASSMGGDGDEDQGLLLQAEANPLAPRMSTTRTANTTSASHDPALASPDATLEKAAAREATPCRDSAVAGSTTINISADTGSLVSGKSDGAAVAVVAERGQERGKVRYVFRVCASTMSYTRYCVTFLFLAHIEAGHLSSACVVQYHR